MDVEFEFKEKNGGACVTKLLAPGAVCVVPESLGGLPVTELADKVFSGSTVEKVYLPRTLTRIGRYEFYGCEKLQEIHFYGALREVGGGVFTGCRNIRSLTVHMGVDEESALRDFVTEINERVTVYVFIQGGQNRMQDERDTDSARISLASSTFEEENGETETARVIFPEYYEDSVENTPARIVSIETHGCGHRYRYCFAGRVFQYRGYDELFPHVQVQEQEELVTELALGRLMYPRELSEKFREHYLDYVREHWETAGKLLIQADRLQRNRVSNLEPGKLPWLVDEVLDAARQDAAAGDGQNMSGADEAVKEPGEPENRNQISANLADQLGGLINLAQEEGDTEMVSWLMERRHRLQTAEAEPVAEAAQATGEIQPAVGSTEAPGEPQRPKRKRRFEL